MNPKTILRIATLGMVAGALLLAQGRPRQGPGFGWQQARPRAALQARGGPMGELMAGYLGLTAAQREQIQAIHQNARTQTQPLMQQLRQNRQDLHTAIVTGQPVEALAAAQGNLLGQIAAIQANARQQIRKVLTPEQLAKLDQFQTRRGMRRAGPRSAPPAGR